MIFETQRLLLRRWKEEDLLVFRRINSDPKVMEFYPEVLNAEQSDKIVERAEQHFEKYGFGLFALELKGSGKFIGFVGLQNVPFKSHFTPTIEIGWRIANEHWDKGYATEAAKEVLAVGFRSFCLPEIVAMTYRNNHRSRRVMEKLGMHYDPKDDFISPHPQVRDSWLAPHVLYRAKNPLRDDYTTPSC